MKTKYNFFTYKDEYLFRHNMRVLKFYFMPAWKYLNFELFPKIKQHGKKDGRYSIELPVDVKFEKVYGKMILKFSVKNDIVLLENVEPSKLLDELYKFQAPVYKGVPYTTKKDLKKIKIVEKLLEEE